MPGLFPWKHRTRIRACQSMGIGWMAWLDAKRTASSTEVSRALPKYFCPWTGQGRVNVLPGSWRDLELPESHSSCYYSNRLNSASFVPAYWKCLSASNFIVWETAAFFLWQFNEATSSQEQNRQCTSRAKSPGQAGRNLILIGGTSQIFCPLKRCKAGKEQRLNL